MWKYCILPVFLTKPHTKWHPDVMGMSSTYCQMWDFKNRNSSGPVWFAWQEGWTLRDTALYFESTHCIDKQTICLRLSSLGNRLWDSEMCVQEVYWDQLWREGKEAGSGRGRSWPEMHLSNLFTPQETWDTSRALHSLSWTEGREPDVCAPEAKSPDAGCPFPPGGDHGLGQSHS